MTAQSAREKLVEEVTTFLVEAGVENLSTGDVRLALALIAERLADVSEEQDRAGEAVIPPAWPRRVDLATAVFRAMLSASALGKGGNDK